VATHKLEEHGFVYCWTDHSNNMLYVGSHKGSTDDGYICSSKYMMREYNKRPNDFSRQIISEGAIGDVRNLETTLLQKLNVRYSDEFYNKHQNDGLFFDGWKPGEHSEAHRKNMSIAASKRVRTKSHMKALHDGRRNSTNSKEHNQAVSNAHKGKKLTTEHIEKVKLARAKLPKTRLKEIASEAGKASQAAYKSDPERQKKTF